MAAVTCRWASDPTGRPVASPQAAATPPSTLSRSWPGTSSRRPRRQAAGIRFRLVVADAVYGESSDLGAKRFAAQIPSIRGLRPSHGTWQVVADPAHPPAFTPAEAAERLPATAWKRTVRTDSPSKELVGYVAELELGPS